MEKTMMAHVAKLGEQVTFRLMPISKDCPYNDAIYDQVSKSLTIVSKDKKQTHGMFHKLNSHGRPILQKVTLPTGEKDMEYQYERLLEDVYYEYNLNTKEDIESFLDMFVVNRDSKNIVL